MTFDELPPLFAGLADADVMTALKAFAELEVPKGTTLIEEGDVDPSLVIVQRGTLQVMTADTRLGVVQAGEVVGEIALFAGGVRSASVSAATDARLLVLDRAGYERLRSYQSPVAVVLEEHALRLLTGRLRAASKRISELSEGTPAAVVTPSPGFFDRVAGLVGGGGTFSPSPVEVDAVLGRSPLFAGVPAEVLRAVGARFELIGARRGHFVCTEGETGDRMYVVASGLVDVVVGTDADNVEYLATLEPGEAFGMCALVQPGYRRMASCVAKERTVLLSMDRIRFAELAPAASEAGAALRVAMIRALAEQVAYANGQLALLDIKHKGDYGALKRAGVAMEAHGQFLSEGTRPA